MIISIVLVSLVTSFLYFSLIETKKRIHEILTITENQFYLSEDDINDLAKKPFGKNSVKYISQVMLGDTYVRSDGSIMSVDFKIKGVSYNTTYFFYYNEEFGFSFKDFFPVIINLFAILFIFLVVKRIFQPRGIREDYILMRPKWIENKSRKVKRLISLLIIPLTLISLLSFLLIGIAVLIDFLFLIHHGIVHFLTVTFFVSIGLFILVYLIGLIVYLISRVVSWVLR